VVYAVAPITARLSPDPSDSSDVRVVDVFNSAFAESLKPLGNRDMDLVVSFEHHSIVKLIEETDAVGRGLVKPRRDCMTNNRYEPVDCNNEESVELVGAALFMIIVCRLTGSTAILNRYASWRREREEWSPNHRKKPGSPNDMRSLPINTSWSVSDFCEFLDHEFSDSVSFSNLISKQHKESIPGDIIQNLDAFKRFLTLFVKVYDPQAVFQGSSRDPRKRRHAMIAAVSKAIENSSEKLQSTCRVKFLAHLAVSDLEGTFPGIAGDVTLESTVMGFGSKEGPGYLKLEGCDKLLVDEDLDVEDENALKKKLKRTFEELRTLLLTDKDDPIDGAWAAQVRRALGYEIVLRGPTKTEVLVNVVSRRDFSYIDVEHFLCKIYLFVVMVSCSRTISEHKKTDAGHCHPAELDLNLVEGEAKDLLCDPEELKKAIPEFATRNELHFHETRKALLELHKLGLLDPEGNGAGYMSNQLRHCKEYHAGTAQADMEELGECSGDLCCDDDEIGPEDAHVLSL